MNKTKPIINLAIQVLPKSNTREAYDIIDEAIDVIKNSGVKYVVCPFETVMEGTYDQLFDVVGKVHDRCFKEDADEVLINIKIQSRRDSNVYIDDKTGKYKNKN